MPSRRLLPILRDLDRHRRAFDLDRDRLGEKLMDATSAVILRDMDAETDPDGRRWPRLSPAYEKWKSRVAPGKPMAVLYGHMKTLHQLQGLRRITPREATMIYGVDELAREVATYFQEGNGRQPPRPFYGLSSEAVARCDEVCRRHLESLL